MALSNGIKKCCSLVIDFCASATDPDTELGLRLAFLLRCCGCPGFRKEWNVEYGTQRAAKRRAATPNAKVWCQMSKLSLPVGLPCCNLFFLCQEKVALEMETETRNRRGRETRDQDGQ
jgi:hypothetical protein